MREKFVGRSSFVCVVSRMKGVGIDVYRDVYEGSNTQFDVDVHTFLFLLPMGL